jgi:ribosomal protein S18 acetylase RimI-like enzyme
MKDILGRAKNMRMETVLLHTAIENKRARELFEYHGFTALNIKKGFYPNGQQAVMMSRTLA